jgi:para-aminobenzoate synthetase component 1
VAETRALPLVHELVPAPDPAICCERLQGLPCRLFLDSAARGARLGRYSFVTADPVTLIRSKAAHAETIDTRSGDVQHHAEDALTVARRTIAPFRTDAIARLPPFQGGLAGYIAYDWGLTLERLPAPRYDDLVMDDVVFGLYDWVLAWDHQAGHAWLISTGIPEDDDAQRAQRARDRAALVLDRITVPRQSTDAHTSHLAPRTSHPAPGDSPLAPSYAVQDGWWDPALGLRSSFTRRGYLDAVQRVREYILAGDIFQVNLSQRFEAPLADDPWTLYSRLRAENAAPFAAFMEAGRAVVLSASPERFLKVDATGHVETRPIKGTRPRGVGPEHDLALAQALTESAKDRAENLMIVDLLRNDLSRVCQPGSVRVPELFTLERYATVHHLVSTVVGDLAPGSDALDLLRAAFPGGSITGAPKLRAMEIIAELEPSQRGVYCGSIGYWSVTGELDTSIAIRTLAAIDGRVYFSAGGGIIADSSPEQEYRETLDKARGIIDALHF